MNPSTKLQHLDCTNPDATLFSVVQRYIGEGMPLRDVASTNLRVSGPLAAGHADVSEDEIQAIMSNPSALTPALSPPRRPVPVRPVAPGSGSMCDYPKVCCSCFLTVHAVLLCMLSVPVAYPFFCH